MKVKSRQLRLFLHWLKTEKNRFAYPIRVNRIFRHMIEFNFVGITPAIQGSFKYGKGWYCSIDIWITFDRYYTDLLFDIPILGNRDKHGYFCETCLPEYREYFFSREQLLRKHSFELLLDWINKDLAESTWIEMSGVEDRWFEAVLKRKNGEFHSTTTYNQKGCISHTSSA